MTVPRLLLTAFGLGRLQPAPGTWGSLPPPLLALLIMEIGGPAWLLNVLLVLIALVFSAACVAFGGWAEQYFTRRDPPQVVADEVAGQCLALLALPWAAVQTGDDRLQNLAIAGTAFIAFRFFDITKIPPAAQFQKLREGWGILADDLAAGAYAFIITRLFAVYLWPMVLG